MTEVAALIERRLAQLPTDAEWRDDPDVQTLAHCREYGAITLMHLINAGEGFETQSKDYEFSRMTLNGHWSAGKTDAERSLAHPAWRNRKRHRAGLVSYDLAPSGLHEVSIRGATE